jgi:hypothetical protein
METPGRLFPSPGFFLEQRPASEVVLIHCLGLPASTLRQLALSMEQRLCNAGYI